VADRTGSYEAELVVSDGTDDSEVATVSIEASAGESPFDMVIELTSPGEFAVVSAPTLLSQVPVIEQEDEAGNSLIMVYANNQFLILGEPGFDDEVVKPVAAFYVTASSPATVGLNFAEVSAPRFTSKSLDFGWNLIGTNHRGPAQDELSQLQIVGDTNSGIVTLHVPNTANSKKDTGHVEWEEDGDRDINANPFSNVPQDRELSDLDGYWVFLNGERAYSKILAATEETP
jgi:hypothetical protein